MATDATTSALTPGPQVFYPERDGKPMAETGIHQEAMMELIIGLRDWFANDPLTYVAGNQFLYFVEGDPKRNVSPDVMFIRGVDKTLRPTYKTWLEGGIVPELVIEVSSKSTRRDDLRHKFALYRDDLRVREYFLFDPLREYLKPPLQGFRLVGANYEPIPWSGGRLSSQVIGLDFQPEGQTLRLFDPVAGRIIPTRSEALAAAGRASHDQSQTIRIQAEALRTQTDAIRNSEAALRAQAETIRVSEAALQAQAEALRNSEAALRAQAETIRVSEAALRERDQAIAQAEQERAELRAEIARLRSGERSD